MDFGAAARKSQDSVNQYFWSMKKVTLKILPYFLIALSFLLSCMYLGKSWLESKRQKQGISVTGLASKDFTSDLVTWSASFSRKDMNMQNAFALLKRDAEAIRQWLVQHGIKEEEIVFSAVDMSKDFESVPVGNSQYRQEFSGYIMRQTVTIESKNLEKVIAASREVTSLIEQGVELSSSSPDFYYTKLSDLKIEMLAQATKDGRTRAEQIAKNAGNGLGKLKSADMGIFQITGKNSNENYSWGGTFNTASKEKTATITVKLEFEID